MEYSNPAMTSNRSSSTSLPVLETSYLQDIQNLRSPYMYADSNSIVFQESAASDTEATVLKRRSLSKESSSYDISVESYLQDKGKWQLGSSDSDESLPGVKEKEDEPCLVDTEGKTPTEDIVRHVSEKEHVNNNEKCSEPFNPGEWNLNPLEKEAQNAVKESMQHSDVVPTSEGGASGKSQPDFDQPVRKRDFQTAACYRENSVRLGTGFEQEVHFESASFSSSSSVRLGHNLPRAVVPFTSTPKDSVDVRVRGSFTGLSSVHSEKDNVPCLVDTENRATGGEINRHGEDLQQLYNKRNKESPVDTVERESDKRSEKTSELLDTIPWDTAGKERADNKSEKDSTLLDTIPWESSRKEDKKSSQKTSRLQDTIPWETHRKDETDDDNNSEKASTLLDTIPWETTRKENDSQKTSKRLDTIPWESDRKEGTKENRLSERATELQDTIPWETSRNKGSNNDFEEVFLLEDTIQWETPERGKEESEKIDQTLELVGSVKQKSCASERELVDNKEKSSEPFNAVELEKNGRAAQSAMKEGEQRSYVVPPVELEASSKSQTDCEQPVTRRDFQLAACYSESSVRVGTGFEQEIHFESANFSSSSSVRLGHSLPGAVVPFTSTPKDSVDVHVRGGFTPLSSLKRQHSWNQGARNGHTETHVCGDRCKLRLKGLADCELVAEVSICLFVCLICITDKLPLGVIRLQCYKESKSCIITGL
ncbi:uncharacterized protein LOC118417955 [Branchiostoma floridae]|uniref:Uncharacterized protein LOC118417955 n=1 Tax=Branchiostoma floridae TaxID=7739 RepID=A0A9J7LBA4_BRAFL|nr:uncharacterized protein LOC118417955 [Branchiostoma floridae]